MPGRPSTDETRLYRDSRELATNLAARLNDQFVHLIDRGLFDGFDATELWGELLLALGATRLTLEPDRGRRLARRVIATRTDL